MGERASLRLVSHAPAMTRAVPPSEMAATDSSLKTTPSTMPPPVGSRSPVIVLEPRDGAEPSMATI
jgi:hypothetical protein